MENTNIKNFIIVKNDKKESDIQPDYKAVYRPEGSEFWIDIASGWVKEREDGSKYMSFQMADYREWEYEGKKHWRDGFTIKMDTHQNKVPTQQPVKKEETINAEDIPF